MNLEPARMRTINECLNEIRSFDLKSALTYNFIRKLCEDSKVKHIKHGRKIFVNLDDLLRFLSQ